MVGQTLFTQQHMVETCINMETESQEFGSSQILTECIFAQQLMETKIIASIPEQIYQQINTALLSFGKYKEKMEKSCTKSLLMGNCCIKRLTNHHDRSKMLNYIHQILGIALQEHTL